MFRATRGIGDVEQAKYTQLAVKGATTAVSGAASAGLLSGSVAGPIGLAIAGVGIALSMLFSRRGPQQKIETTAIVNEAEPILRDNRDLYLAGPRDEISYQAALDNFDYTWGQVVKLCSDPKEGEPGQRCVTDRQRGSTKGYDWFALYRDPIAHAEPVSVADTVSSFFDSGTTPFGSWVIPAALIGAGVLFLVSE